MPAHQICTQCVCVLHNTYHCLHDWMHALVWLPLWACDHCLEHISPSCALGYCSWWCVQRWSNKQLLWMPCDMLSPLMSCDMLNSLMSCDLFATPTTGFQSDSHFDQWNCFLLILHNVFMNVMEPWCESWRDLSGRAGRPLQLVAEGSHEPKNFQLKRFRSFRMMQSRVLQT